MALLNLSKTTKRKVGPNANKKRARKIRKIFPEPLSLKCRTMTRAHKQSKKMAHTKKEIPKRQPYSVSKLKACIIPET